MTLFDKVSRALKAGHDQDDDVVLVDERHLPSRTGRHLEAAVLIAITDRPEPGVILTQRPKNMRSHPGQVAFPGGKIDPEDDGAIGAALREAHEEIGLEAANVRIVGATDDYKSGSGYAITPIVGIVPPDLEYRPNPLEVESWFETPLAFLLDPSNLIERSAIWEGQTRRYGEILWRERRIWGVTAGIISNLRERLAALEL